MILQCFRCRDEDSPGAKYQDRTYGKGNRVHNATDQRIGSKTVYRCTICKNEQAKGR